MASLLRDIEVLEREIQDLESSNHQLESQLQETAMDSYAPMSASTPGVQDSRSGNMGKIRSKSFLSETTDSEKRPICLPNDYSGSSSFKDWLIHFKLCKELNNWSNERACLFLAIKLKGSALQVYSTLDDSVKNDFSKLVDTLTDRFDPLRDTGVYWSQLRSRVRKDGESLLDLSSSIEHTVSKAFPLAGHDLKVSLALQLFLDSLKNDELVMQIRRSKPESLAEAIKIALDEESFLKLKNKKLKVNEIFI